MSEHKTIQDLIEYYIPDKRQRIYDLKRNIKQRLRNINFHIIKLTANYLAATLTFLLVFGMVNHLWFIYYNTSAGVTFLESNPPETLLALFAVTRNDLIWLALKLNFDATVSCLLIGLLCQLFGITRYFYIGRGLINRLFWVTFCAAITSLDFFQIDQSFDLRTGLPLYLLPVCWIVDTCFKLSSLLLPEIWALFRLVTSLRQAIKIARIRN